MNKQEFAPFYVGQEVEAVENSSYYSKGHRFTVKGVMISPCKCQYWVISIGIKNPYSKQWCSNCSLDNMDLGTSAYFNSRRFRAITPAMEAVTFEKITEQHPVSVN